MDIGGKRYFVFIRIQILELRDGNAKRTLPSTIFSRSNFLFLNISNKNKPFLIDK